MEYIIVGVGGLFGSLARFSLGRMVSGKCKTKFPLPTFIINVTGAVLLGFISSFNMYHNWYLLLADGFLGAYTTFSTFMYEGFNLISQNKSINACIYIISSLFIGLSGFALGTMTAVFIKQCI